MDARLIELPVLQCALDAEGLAAQRARYARVAAARVASRRTPGELVVEFDPGALDRELLRQALAIERECCPFYELRLEGTRLSVRVAEPHLEPALDAIDFMLGLGPAAATDESSGRR